MRVAIIGGSGEFGRLFARLFRREGHEVTITGRDRAKGEAVAGELGVGFTTDNAAAAREADIVVISVYIENTLEVIEEVAPHLRPGTLLMDVTSVKVGPCAAMARLAPEGVDVVGTHPMFGPREATFEGLTFILTPVRGTRWEGFLRDLLAREKAKVVVTTPEEHDEIMAVVQGLTHFTYISVASTLRELGVDVRRSRSFASPIYGLMLDLIARIVGQSPRLYASIQMENPMVGRVHQAFIAQAERLRQIVEGKDMAAFAGVMTESARQMGDIEAAKGRSDKVILAMREELRRLKEAVGREVAMKHIYSGAIHVGRVVRVEPEAVTIASERREVTLRLSNVELLDEGFLQRWKRENLPRVKRDFSFLFPEGVEEGTLAEVVLALDGRVVSCTVLDVYRGPQVPAGMKSITLRVEALGPEEDLGKLERVLVGLGGTLR